VTPKGEMVVIDPTEVVKCFVGGGRKEKVELIIIINNLSLLSMLPGLNIVLDYNGKMILHFPPPSDLIC